MATVKFATGTSASFGALTSKDANTIYFITDTQQIFKGATAYTENVIVTASLPESGRQGVLYVDSTKKSLHYWDGTAFQQMSVELVTTIGDDASDSVAPTAKAVKDYVDTQIGGSAAIAVNEVTYDNTKHQLSVTKGTSAAVTTYVAGLVTDYAYEATTGVVTLTFTDDKGATTTKTIELPKEQALTGLVQHTVTEEEAGNGIYASATKGEIGLLATVSNLSDSTTVQYFVSLKNFIDVYTTGSAAGDAVKIAVDSSTNKITASISLDEGEFSVGADGKITVNKIAADKITGLNDAVTAKADKVANATADNIAALDADGNLTDSGIAKSAIATKTEVAGKMNKLAAAATGQIIIGGADDATVTGAGFTIGDGATLGDGATVVATEGAVTNALTWKTIG